MGSNPTGPTPFRLESLEPHVNSIVGMVALMSTSKKQKKHEDLESLKQALGEQAAKLHGELKAIEERLGAVTLTLQMLRGGANASRENKDPYLREFKGLTQVQALMKIARDSGNNRFKLRDAKRILLDAGLIKTKKNANTILFTAIQRSGKFARVAPGEYEVIAKPDIQTLNFTKAS